MGRWRQCGHGVGKTTRPDCTTPSAPPEQGEVAPASRATLGWIAKAKPKICAEPEGSRILDAMGNGGFSGVATAARGKHGGIVRALILMGDWCATSRNLQPRTKRAGAPAGHGRDQQMRGEPQSLARPIATGRLMGDPF